MCGIIAVLRRRPGRPPPDPGWIADQLAAAAAAMSDRGDGNPTPVLEQAAVLVAAVDAALRGPSGVTALLADPNLAGRVAAVSERLEADVAAVEAWADTETASMAATAVESLNGAIVRLKDAVWALGHDRVRTAAAVADLAGPTPPAAAVEAFTSVQVALSAIDRLEVRGRDSAGLHLLVEGHGLDLDAPEVAATLHHRVADPLFTSMAVRTPRDELAFVYKAAAEIGELGDNTRVLRAAIRGDELLHRALQADDAQCTVVGHTRWASVGIISEPNAHPLDSIEEGRGGPYVVGVLNGDVDNHDQLRQEDAVAAAAEVTTDAKVIPVLVSHRMAEGVGFDDAFRSTVARFEGSVAIVANAADEPGRLALAQRGSGQALYVGLAEDSFVVASEPYGLVEETAEYVRLDGEAKAPSGSQGQVVFLDRAAAGTVDGITRLAYDGSGLPISANEVATASITTRDIDRGEFPHYLLKEVSEAPRSFRKTLRGRIVDGPSGATVSLDDDVLPPSVTAGLRDGRIRRVDVIGQGTAAVAGQGVASLLERALSHTTVAVSATPATELSGFGLEDDMSDRLVVAISQSGTTTDTNRTVDLVRGRGGSVIAIVNRRNSDLVEKADGVLYTSDGRDVEMSVPSTKAFYAQIAAGAILAIALAVETGGDRAWGTELTDGLRRLPDALDATLAVRPALADAAHQLAPMRRHWAVVGNGANRVAAEEVRIKLSELCYKSIACDVTEDKKHIDLSSEPLILVCAAGLTGANGDDVAKEVAIYRAHKAAPVVIATDGESRFSAALHTIGVPDAHPDLAFVLSAMAGHLFAYEAALAIDAQARPFREARAAVEAAVSSGAVDILEDLGRRLEPLAGRFLDDLRAGTYDGTLSAGTAVRVASLLRYAGGISPLDAYQLEFGKVGTPSVVVQDLTDALTAAIEELTRPIDAIKHQAKTVTVGISRTEEALLEVPLTAQLLRAGADADRLSYRTLRTLAAIDAAVADVTGYTRYRIDGSVAGGDATIHVVDKGGVAQQIASRTDTDSTLRGTKHRVATQQEVTIARGRRDGRPFVIVPETKDRETTALTLLHTRFHDRLPGDQARRALEGYQGRYAALRDAVTETEPLLPDDLLGQTDVIDLFDLPVHVLADRWRAR